MPHAESLAGHIERRQGELRSLAAKLDQPLALSGSDWDPREILLHLLGATRGSADDLRLALGGRPEQPPRQAGGQYIDIPELATASEAADALLSALSELRESVRMLDDEALGRRVTIEIAGTGPADVPIGLVLRNGLTAHFDEHIAQLREATPSQSRHD
jgi:hypothetical protein